MPFARTSHPGLTVVGSIETDGKTIDFSSRENWQAQVDESVQFPMGLKDDMFLHVSYYSFYCPLCPTNGLDQ